MQRCLILALAAAALVPRSPAAHAEGADTPAAASLPDAGGAHWRLRTPHGPVHVWTPPGYRPETAGIVVYVHGYYTSVDRAWRNHRLAEQLAASGRNALFIVPEAPARAAQDVRWHGLGALVLEVAAALPHPRPPGPVVAVGHSGAYRTLLEWLDDPLLAHIILIDGLYAHEQPFLDWLARPRAPARRLTMVAIDTLRWSALMADRVPDTRTLDWIPEDPGDVPADVRDARLLHIHAQHGHMDLVTQGTTIPVLLRMTNIPAVP